MPYAARRITEDASCSTKLDVPEKRTKEHWSIIMINATGKGQPTHFPSRRVTMTMKKSIKAVYKKQIASMAYALCRPYLWMIRWTMVPTIAQPATTGKYIFQKLSVCSLYICVVDF